MKRSNNFKNFIMVFGANMFVMLIGIIQAFILPKTLGPEQYGYWSMYLLYVGYAGFFGLGIADGLYLTVGGKKYEDLAFGKIKTITLVHVAYLTVLLIVWVSICMLCIADAVQKIVMIAVGISTVISCLINLLTSIDQATSRFKIYSRGHIIEKIFIMAGILIYLVTKKPYAMFVVCASVIGRFITLLYYSFFQSKVLKSKAESIKLVLPDIGNYIFIGIWITIASIGTSAMTGIGKIFIEKTMGVVELGNYSFVLSISGLFTQFFTAIATVFFPAMRQKAKSEYVSSMVKLDKLFTLLGGVCLLLYYPARLVLAEVFPKYVDALPCLLVLFPLVVLTGKMSVIYNTMYKVDKQEREIVYNLVVALIMCTVLTFIFSSIENTVYSVALATLVSYAIWCIVTVLRHNMKNHYGFGYGVVFLMETVVFVLANTIFGFTWVSFLISMVVIVPCFVAQAYRDKAVWDGLSLRRRKKDE